MPYEIHFPEARGGYAMNHARPGEIVQFITREFTSSEDGDHFISRLEGLPRILLSRKPGEPRVKESTIDHMLAIVRPDYRATVYVNELEFVGKIRPKHAVKAGDPITLDSILDVATLEVSGVSIPDDAGVLLILSAGWRKGLFFDLSPLVTGQARDYNLPATFAQYQAYLWFQELLSMTTEIWTEILKQSWFPFIYLKQETLKGLVGAARAGLSCDSYLDTAEAEVAEGMRHCLPAWRSRPVFTPHLEVIEAAFGHLTRRDYLSAASMIYPRIEGVMRSNHFLEPDPPKASQKNLVTSIVEGAELPLHTNSLLLPERFRRYLREIYFADFDPRRPSNLSRNSAAHGVAPVGTLDRKGALLGFLTLLQIGALLPVGNNGGTPAE